MNPITRPCPFCNAESPIPAGTEDGQRVPCVRCGEAFVYHGPAVLAGGPSLPTVLEVSSRPTNRKVALSVLGLMALMAAVGLAYALATVSFRRSRDQPARSTEAEVAAVHTVAPVDLAGLRYLPPNIHVAVGLHVAELLEQPSGRRFLNRFRPTDLLPRNPQMEITGNLETVTGLRLDDLDHLVLGLHVEGRLTPGATLVARARQRLDPAAIQAALRATPIPDPEGRQFYRFKPEQPLDTIWPEALLWLPDEWTVVVRELDKDSKPSSASAEALPRGLRTLLKERIGPGSPGWIVGQVDWSKTGIKFLLPTMPAAERETLERLQAFAGSVQLHPELTVRAVFQTADAASAERLEQYLTPPAADRKPLRLLGSRPEAAAVAEELAESRKVTRDAVWVTLQARARLETLHKALAETPSGK